MEQKPLRTFEIERWELHVGKVHIQAESFGHALARMLQGDGDSLHESVFHGLCDLRGVHIDEFLCKQLAAFETDVSGIVPGVKSIRVLDDQDT